MPDILIHKSVIFYKCSIGYKQKEILEEEIFGTTAFSTFIFRNRISAWFQENEYYYPKDFELTVIDATNRYFPHKILIHLKDEEMLLKFMLKFF